MASGITLRRAARTDVPAILTIFNEAVLNTTASYEIEPVSLEARLAWFDAHTAEGYAIFVAEDEGGRILGWSSLSAFHPRPGYRFTAEDSIYVAADARGRGVGKALLEPLIPAARERGLHAIVALIDADNDVSIRLHTSAGFEEVGHLRQVGRKFDRWLDMVYMELLVD